VIQLSAGQGRTNAQGQTIDCDGDSSTVRLISNALAAMAPAVEAWWSPHTWRDSYRNAERWESSCAAVIDVDHVSSPRECPEAPEDDVDALCMRVRSGEIPGSLFHLTPHGARIIFPFTEQCIDRDRVVEALRGACALVASSVDGLNYRVDEGTSCDVARFFYTPNSIAKNVERRAFVVQMSPEPWDVDELARHAPREATVVTLTPPTITPSSAYGDAVARFNQDHPLNIDRHSGQCPICEHNGCFGYLPNDNQRWFCWSSNHSGIGVRSPRGHHGDSLDLFAHENGVSPVTVLVRMGYLAPRAPELPAPTGEGGEVIPIRRGLRNNSFETACTIISREAYPTEFDTNLRDILRGRSIRHNEMTGVIELGVWPERGEPTVTELRDVDVDIVKLNIERFYSGGIDNKGNEVGLKIARNDVERAIHVIASEHEYHPVRDYLSSLAWDGEERIARIASRILGAEDTPLNRVLIRKTLISAVARVMRPGCKVDTMLVLQGVQGAMKSTFWRALASPWFVDTPVDISSDPTRAYQVMRSAWIYEWAELETLLKARDFSSVKAFLSSPEDTYIPKYGRNRLVVKRSGVIVGTINPAQFLDDETGARRFWIIKCGQMIDIALAAHWRDSIWAEAVVAFRAGEQWWLEPAEEAALASVHEEHRVGDVWEDIVLPWAASQTDPFTTGRVLSKAVSKPEGQWNRGDEMRVAKILKAAGYERKSCGADRVKKWMRRTAQTELTMPGESSGSLPGEPF